MTKRPHGILNRKPLKEKRRTLRSTATPAEAALWKILSGRKLDGFKFRRQQSIGPYIVDFYCPAEMMVIELDGEVHNNMMRSQYDFERERYLRSRGFEVLRFENKMVFAQPECVMDAIRQYLDRSEPPPAPPLKGGELGSL